MPQEWTLRVSKIGHMVEAKPNAMVYGRYQFSKGSCTVAIGTGLHRELQTKLPRAGMPYAEVLVNE